MSKDKQICDGVDFSVILKFSVISKILLMLRQTFLQLYHCL